MLMCAYMVIAPDKKDLLVTADRFVMVVEQHETQTGVLDRFLGTLFVGCG